LRALLDCILVPVYDCREVSGKFANILSNLKDVPQYGKDIPSGSCAVVGYMVSTFNKRDGDMPAVSFNIHWSMLLALPVEGKKVGG
jgi:hypothetical protein